MASAPAAGRTVVAELSGESGPTSPVDLTEVAVGVIGRPHGVRGDLTVTPRTDEPERRFAVGAQLRSEDGRRQFTVTEFRLNQGRLLVRFAEVADRTAAESVRGMLLVTDVPLAEVPSDDGEFYDRQLVGLNALLPDGSPVGTVRAVRHLPAQDALEIQTGQGIRLVPFVTALVPDVDLAAGTLTVAAVPGLLTDDPEPADPEPDDPAPGTASA